MIFLKPNIFVSSTVSDLTNERVAAKRAIESIPGNPQLSEYTFEAVDDNSLNKCLDEVKNCDIFILILGSKYGYIIDEGISITEKEYNTAKHFKKPILVFNTNYEKELKQKEFEKRVGEYRFWKNVDNAFELESEITASVKKCVADYKFERKNQTETIYSNLLEFDFPNEISIAELGFDRNEIIENSKSSIRKLTKRAKQREVVFEALRQKGLKFSGEWVCMGNKLISFHDLSNSKLPLYQIIDAGTTDHLQSSEFYGINNDNMNVFKSLLRFSLQKKLYQIGIEWRHEEKLFVFMPNNDLRKRVENWFGKVSATRTVFEAKKQKKNPEKISFCKHFAFSVSFHQIENSWFLSINPEWFITYDGFHKSRFGSDQIKYYKSNERNKQVFNHVKFIAFKLKHEKPSDLFNSEKQENFLNFKKIVCLDSFPKVNDAEWMFTESSSENLKLIDVEKELSIFDL